VLDNDGFSQWGPCGHSGGHAPLALLAVSAMRAVEAAYRIGDEDCALAPSSQRTDVLLESLGERSCSLHEHCSNVGELAEAVSRAHGLPEIDVQWIRLAAELHDVGKVQMPDAILDKPGPLNDDEWAFMRRHTVLGERMIRGSASLAPAARLVRSSHERYDGKGYPDGLCAGEIAVGASIIAVCDAYDAMVNDRVYRLAMSQQEALAELGRCAGTQFDPAIVELFCAIVEQRDDRHALDGDDHR